MAVEDRAKVASFGGPGREHEERDVAVTGETNNLVVKQMGRQIQRILAKSIVEILNNIVIYL